MGILQCFLPLLASIWRYGSRDMGDGFMMSKDIVYIPVINGKYGTPADIELLGNGVEEYFDTYGDVYFKVMRWEDYVNE